MDVNNKPRKKRKRKYKSFKKILRDAMRPRKTKEEKRKDQINKIKSVTGSGTFAKVDII